MMNQQTQTTTSEKLAKLYVKAEKCKKRKKAKKLIAKANKLTNTPDYD